MSCGNCGTDSPHGEKSAGEGKCMACECPCEMHKEHTHGHEEHHEEKPSGVCESCSHAHNQDGHCDCGCA